MGNDGGSIPTRRELVKSAARLPTISELKATALEALTHAWQTDPVTSDALDLSNVVSDWRGRLYNYETVLTGLMPGATDTTHDNGNDEDASAAAAADDGGDLTFAATGIRSLRDVVRLQGTPSSAPSSAQGAPPPGPTKSGYGGEGPSLRCWQCPVSLKELGPATKALYLVPCGHVFSEVAVETFLPDKLCPTCSTPFAPENGVMPILPTDKAELARLRQRIDTLRAAGLTHSLKKDKSGDKKKKHGKKEKRKAGAVEDDGEAAAQPVLPPPYKKTRDKNGSAAADAGGISSRINNPATASLTSKVLAEQEALHKRRKLASAR